MQADVANIPGECAERLTAVTTVLAANNRTLLQTRDFYGVVQSTECEQSRHIDRLLVDIIVQTADGVELVLYSSSKLGGQTHDQTRERKWWRVVVHPHLLRRDTPG